ncbi:hypothetical protein H2204_003927 [Knufia peltigerae]|uniref:Phosducin domain-containing protein n=1 Tax=Knufia peltigerae TaxID=1002370 RepID=A0AA39D028_9EURO|nr:hypothetical protein H2204_003927 [Knufia peltigerae]
MADLAREEADRYFSHQDHSASHPEDIDDSDRSSDHRPQSPDQAYHSDPGTDDDDADATNMATMTTTRTSYHLPSQAHFANTGPKGVIADAQSFARAKQTTFRQRIASFAGNLTSSHKPSGSLSEKPNKRKSIFSTSPKSNSSGSEQLTLSDDEADSDFMKTWRENRLAELSSQSQSAYNSQKRQYPSQRSWGTFYEVDASGYLDAIEKVSDDTVVVVMIHDPLSTASAEVEDELSTLAYKHNKTHFIRLHHEVAEMETVEVPAVLAYRGGDVFATISGAKAEGLEGVLIRNRVL